ncbi:MAG: 30S ribosomal protein S16, partial [Agrococcus casei]
GKYHPTEQPSFIEVDSERAQYWLSVGAQPSEQVAALLKLTGDWAKFKGEGDTESKVQAPEGKREFTVDAAKKTVLKPKAEPKAEEPAAAEAPAEEAAPAADEAPAEEAAAETEQSE